MNLSDDFLRNMNHRVDFLQNMKPINDCFRNMKPTDDFPRMPGCYMFKNKRDEIIYIGKSKSLRNRIKQHLSGGGSGGSGGSGGRWRMRGDGSAGEQQRRRAFGGAGYIDYKHEEMMRELYAIDILPTDTETDALILECRLIKAHKPKYNALLKHDRVFPFIRVDMRQPYPTLSIASATAKDGCAYYGSFYSYYDAEATLALINSIWRTPLCGKTHFGKVRTGDLRTERVRPGKTQRPCLQYHLHKCCAPCAGEADEAAYGAAVNEIVRCLGGHFRATLNRLTREMNAAATEMRFEQAAVLRDQLQGLRRLRKKQQRFCTDLANREVYVFFRAFKEKRFSLFFIKNGVTLGRADYDDIANVDEAWLAAFVRENTAYETELAGSTEVGSFFTACLLEIGASKLFVPVSRRMSETSIIAKLLRAWQVYKT